MPRMCHSRLDHMTVACSCAALQRPSPGGLCWISAKTTCPTSASWPNGSSSIKPSSLREVPGRCHHLLQRLTFLLRQWRVWIAWRMKTSWTWVSVSLTWWISTLTKRPLDNWQMLFTFFWGVQQKTSSLTGLTGQDRRLRQVRPQGIKSSMPHHLQQNFLSNHSARCCKSERVCSRFFSKSLHQNYISKTRCCKPERVCSRFFTAYLCNCGYSLPSALVLILHHVEAYMFNMPCITSG